MSRRAKRGLRCSLGGPGRRAWRSVWLPSLMLSGATLVCGSAAGASGANSQWSTGSAKLMPEGRWEFGVFSQARWGVSDRLELGAHPLWFFVLPHLEAKLGIAESSGWHLATRHRVSYPTPFLNLVAKEGSGGLLPADTQVPQTLLLSSAVLTSVEWRPEQLLTAELGLTVAAHRDDALPLLDFPFLYQRFAALNAPGVPHFGLNAEGRLSGPLSYAAELKLFLLPVLGVSAPIDGAWALEGAVNLNVDLGACQRVSAGLRWARARFPIGDRSHWLPLVDYRVAF